MSKGIKLLANKPFSTACNVTVLPPDGSVGHRFSKEVSEINGRSISYLGSSHHHFESYKQNFYSNFKHIPTNIFFKNMFYFIGLVSCTPVVGVTSMQTPTPV